MALGTSPAIMQFETFAQLLDEPFVGGMITSPKPRSRVTFKYAQGPIAQGDPERPDVGFRFNTFKSERGMEGVFFPDFESLLSCLSGGIWQLTIGFPKCRQRLRDDHSFEKSMGSALPLDMCSRTPSDSSTSFELPRWNWSSHFASSKASEMIGVISSRSFF